MTVALSGTGGDELFYGYNKYSFFYGHRNLYRFLPPILRGLRPVDPLFAHFPSYRRACSLLRGDAGWRFIALKNSGAGDLLAKIPRARELARTLAFDGRRNLAFQARDFDMRETLPGNYYPAIDRGSMRASLEVRTPFLSRKLVETLAGFDQRAFLAFGQKSVLRRILYRYVPREAMQDVKQGFVFPAKRYLAARPDAVPGVAGVPEEVRAEIWRNRHDPAFGMLAVRLCVLEAFAKGAAGVGARPQPQPAKTAV
jgi:asparagine synthase (glutamine-hydrolysing)